MTACTQYLHTCWTIFFPFPKMLPLSSRL